jgi:MFS family permease
VSAAAAELPRPATSRRSARGSGLVRTQIPARLDRLPWSKFHWRIVIGLGTVWILDGLEVTIVGAVASRLISPGSGITMNAAEIGYAASAYVVGACLGAIFFGYLTDRFGRKKLFMITLGMYIVCTAATGAAFSWWYFVILRLLTGAGIGGEYASINSAIDELIPARARGTIDLAINGSYWAGSIAGSALALVLLDEALLPANIGWRVAFGMGVVLGLLVLLVRRNVPESPRWLFLHGREEEAEQIVDRIEGEVAGETGQRLAPVSRTLTVRPRARTPISEIVRTAFGRYPRRALLALALFVGQAFLYNGITFNIGTLLTTFFGVASGVVPVFMIVYGASNLAGPLTIGRLFDTVGRRPMIAGTYLGSAALGGLLAWLFATRGELNAWTFMALLMASFFLASAGASAAYLTASEIFPMEMRALAIAVFYAVGTGLGGIIGPLLFASWISSGHRGLVATAFLIGAGVMALGGVVELLFGVKAERAQLEDVAAPLAEVSGDATDTGGAGEAPGEPGELEGGRLEALRHRERAAMERARAAEHRATAHDLLAAATTPGYQAAEAARARADEEEVLARIADQLALAADERAVAAEEPAELAAAAARERALAHEEEARHLGAGNEDDERRHRELAEAAYERARRREQENLALSAREAERADRVVAEAEAIMHERWARLHAARAEGHELLAAGDDGGAAQAFARADALEEEGRAAASRVEAAARRAEAAADAAEEEQAASSRRAAEAERRRRDEERVRERIAARRRADTLGLRRYRPGPGRAAMRGYALPLPPPEEALDEQVAAIVAALEAHGAMERRELAREVGARYWGPGAFSAALRQAALDGEVRRLSRNVYAPGDSEEAGERGQQDDGGEGRRHAS